MSMFRKYLLKRSFWAAPRKNEQVPTRYVKHEVNVGGIYAYLEHKGVKIVANGESTFFDNFIELDKYLDGLAMRTAQINTDVSDFITIMNRRNSSKLLRKIPI